MTDEELVTFALGLEAFEEIETVDDGLGPVFNDASCASCHAAPATGGVGGTIETRFGRTRADGTFDPMVEFG